LKRQFVAVNLNLKEQMPTPKSKRRRLDPPAKEKEESHIQAAPSTTTTEPTSNGTMAQEAEQRFETLQLHAG
jgi:hypothetical protein